MTTTDPRTILAEIKTRLGKLDEVNTADIGLQMSAHYAVDTMLREDLPAMAAALTAVLDLYKHVTYPDEGDPYLTGRADGYELAMARVHREIKHALGGDRG